MKKTETETEIKEPLQRLLNAKKACATIQKRGLNTFNKYTYVKESDIVAVVSEACYDNQLMYSCSYRDAVIERGVTKNGSPNSLCSIWCDLTVIDPMTGQILEKVSAFGEASDTSDKASFKAQTGAKKYALMGLFCIATSDDPEHDSPLINDTVKNKLTGKSSSYSYLVPYDVIEADKDENGVSKKLEFLKKLGFEADPDGYSLISNVEIKKLATFLNGRSV